MDIKKLLEMDKEELVKRYYSLSGKDWREKAVIKGIYISKGGNKNLFNNIEEGKCLL